MNEFERFQELQRLLVESGLDTRLDARREGNEAVFSLAVRFHGQTPEKMAALTAVTSANGVTFIVSDDTAQIKSLDS